MKGILIRPRQNSLVNSTAWHTTWNVGAEQETPKTSLTLPWARKIIAILQAICYRLVELPTPPEIKQIKLITRECVTKIMSPTRDKDGYPISGQDVVP